MLDCSQSIRTKCLNRGKLAFIWVDVLHTEMKDRRSAREDCPRVVLDFELEHLEQRSWREENKDQMEALE